MQQAIWIYNGNGPAQNTRPMLCKYSILLANPFRKPSKSAETHFQGKLVILNQSLFLLAVIHISENAVLRLR